MIVKRLLFGIALAGLIVAGYLAYAYQSGAPIPCSVHGGCDIVRESAYAQFYGLSTPLYGVLFYVLLLAGAERWNGRRDSVWFVFLRVLTLAGFAVSVYLSYLESFVILAWCTWCVASAVIATAAFGLMWWTEEKV